MKSIATDNYDFKTLIENGYAYVDKTDMLWKLANGRNGTLFFISRPRRFGKSLMLSTLKYLFEGRKKLFKGLKIEKKKWNWAQTYPVIDLNMSDFDKEGTREGFRRSLRTYLQESLERSSIPYKDTDSPAMLFDRLIKGLAAANEGDKRVVILVDEYDHPLGGFLDDRRALRAMRREMHGFYSTLKNNVGVIRFLMMTGVSKFTKLSVFSGLNNLQDLTIERPDYAALLGYTVKEIGTCFAPHLKVFARKQRVPQEKAIKLLCAWYDSYRFSPYSSARVLNPVAVGKALSIGKLANYLIDADLAALIKQLKAGSNMPESLGDFSATLDDLELFDTDYPQWKAYLLQNGYLTIKKAVWTEDKHGRHVSEVVLGVPNREVQETLDSVM